MPCPIQQLRMRTTDLKGAIMRCAPASLIVPELYAVRREIGVVAATGNPQHLAALMQQFSGLIETKPNRRPATEVVIAMVEVLGYTETFIRTYFLLLDRKGMSRVVDRIILDPHQEPDAKMARMIRHILTKYRGDNAIALLDRILSSLDSTHASSLLAAMNTLLEYEDYELHKACALLRKHFDYLASAVGNGELGVVGSDCINPKSIYRIFNSGEVELSQRLAGVFCAVPQSANHYYYLALAGQKADLEAMIDTQNPELRAEVIAYLIQSTEIEIPEGQIRNSRNDRKSMGVLIRYLEQLLVDDAEVEGRMAKVIDIVTSGHPLNTRSVMHSKIPRRILMGVDGLRANCLEADLGL